MITIESFLCNIGLENCLIQVALVTIGIIFELVCGLTLRLGELIPNSDLSARFTNGLSLQEPDTTTVPQVVELQLLKVEFGSISRFRIRTSRLKKSNGVAHQDSQQGKLV